MHQPTGIGSCYYSGRVGKDIAMHLTLRIDLGRPGLQEGHRLTTALMLGLLLTSAATLWAQAGFQIVTGKELDSAVPKDFYLEGNAIPVEKRNTVMLKTPSGARVLVALIDTAGYSSQIQQKYIGMLIAEAPLAACSVDLAVGSYGFGLQKPASQDQSSGEFLVYDQSGKQLGSCPAEADHELKQPRPLQVTAGSGAVARLRLGRYWIVLRSKQ
jgi:hypothetical protein